MQGAATPNAGRILWLTSDKPETISVGRERIADHLSSEWGYDVTLRGTTPRTVREAIRDRNEFDAVVGTTRAGAIAGALLKLLSGTPLVVDHVDPIRQFEETNPRPTAAVVRRLENRTFSLADHVCYVYDEEAARVERHAKSSSRTALGVEYDRFASPDPANVEAAEARLAAHGVEGNVAVYVGGLEPIYHVEELLDAMAHLDDWTLAVLGTGSLSSTVMDRAARSGSVEYLGTVPHREVPGYLHAADAGVCLVDDPHTLKVLEYLAAGLPVVQLRGRTEGRFGDLLTYADPGPSSIARAIEHAGVNQDSAAHAGASDDPEARRAFARRFDWGEISETYRAVLDDVTGNRRDIEPWKPTTYSS